MPRWDAARRWLWTAVADEDRRSSAVAAVTLFLALAPIVVTVGGAISAGWVPLFDGAYFTVRSRDVLTEHHPWLGAWSAGSVALGASVRNLGPLQLDLLAPFTKLDPYWGTAVGVGAVAAACVLAVWWAARRVLGPLGASGAMVATLAVETTIGSQAFLDARQQLFLLLPYWALLWLAWAVALGDGAASVPLVVVGSLILQTHFTYAVQTSLILAAALAGYVATAVRQRAGWGAARPWLVALGVAGVCWAQPLWDQVAGERNLGAVLAHQGDNAGTGWSRGAQVVAGAVLLPPHFWSPGTMGAFDLPADLVPLRTAIVAAVVWSALVGAAALLARRHGSRALAALGAMAIVALVAALAAGARIPSSAFGLIPQNYYWLWPTGVFLTVAVAAAPLAAFGSRWLASPAGAMGLAAVAVVAVFVACRPVDHFATVASERTAGARLGRPVVEQLAASLRRHDVDGPLEVDATRASFGNYMRYAFLAELQRAGIEFTYPPGERDIERFGSRRCERGRAVGRIVLADAGGDPVVRDGEVVLADVDAFRADGRAQLAALDRRFGDLLRDGRVELDRAGLELLAGGEVPGLAPVLSSPGTPATGLATVLAPWTGWGVVDVPADLQDDFDRWVDLETRSSLEVVTILLAPPRPDRSGARLPVTHRFCPD
jgi:hypothetical protein